MVQSGPLLNNILDVGTADRKKRKQGVEMVHCDTSWKDSLEVGTADTFF